MVEGELALGREKKENTDFPTRRDWGKTLFSVLYIGLLIIIVVSALWKVYNVSKETKKVEIIQNEKKEVPSNQLRTVSSEQKEKTKTITETVLVPMAESEKVRIIFEHLFYAFLVFICTILVPIPFDRMKRLKLMNFEVELDAQGQEIVSTLSIQQDKFQFLTYWLREENKRAFMISERNNESYKDFVIDMFEEMKKHYRVNWNIHFEYTVLTEEQFTKNKFKIPFIVRRSLNAAKESLIGLPINKENESNVHFKNYMIYPVTETENLYTESEAEVNYVIVLTSYRSSFDEYDGQLVSGLCSLTSELYKRSHLLKAVQEMAN